MNVGHKLWSAAIETSVMSESIITAKQYERGNHTGPYTTHAQTIIIWFSVCQILTPHFIIFTSAYSMRRIRTKHEQQPENTLRKSVATGLQLKIC